MNPPETMTAAQFQALCGLIWGDGWRPEAADALGVSLRNVQFWAAEPPARGKTVPPGVADELVRRAVALMDDPEHARRIRAAVARHASQTDILELVIALERSQRPGGG